MGAVLSEARELETLRKRARLSYGIYGAGLLCAVLMAFVSHIGWALAVAGLTVALNLLICGRDVRAYRGGYRRAKCLRAVKGVLTDCEYAEKDLFPVSVLKKDGVLPGRVEDGVVRTGIRGRLTGGLSAELADISFPLSVDMGGTKPRNRILSGVYLRVEGEDKKKKRTGKSDGDGQESDPGQADFACFHEDSFFAGELRRHYEGQDWYGETWRRLYICVPAGSPGPDSPLKTELADFYEEYGTMAVFCRRQGRILVFLPKRYLNPGEPDFKHAVTEESLAGGYLPELRVIRKLFAI